MVTMTDLSELGACSRGRMFASGFIKDAQTGRLGIDAKDVRKLRTSLKRIHKNQLTKFQYYSEGYRNERAERRTAAAVSLRMNYLNWYLSRCITNHELRYDGAAYERLLTLLQRLLGLEGHLYDINKQIAVLIMGCTNEQAITIAEALNLWLNGLPTPNALLRSTRRG